MNIDVLDMDVGTLGTVAISIERRNARVPSGERSVIVKLYGMSTGLPQTVSEIENVAYAHSIDVLRIWGSGSPGKMTGGDASGAGGRDDFAGLTLENVERHGAKLKKLAPLFKPQGRVELRGCNVSQGNGAEMIAKLAQDWGVKVHAGPVLQHATPNWDGMVTQADRTGKISSVRGLPLE